MCLLQTAQPRNARQFNERHHLLLHLAVLKRRIQRNRRCIYSSADKADALVRWMKYDQMPTGMPNEYSEEMIEQNIALADYLGLQGTPAIFLSDGRGPFGAMSAKALAHKIISAEHY